MTHVYAIRIDDLVYAQSFQEPNVSLRVDVSLGPDTLIAENKSYIMPILLERAQQRGFPNARIVKFALTEVECEDFKPPQRTRPHEVRPEHALPPDQRG
jgi:hypothetical protein